MYGTLREAAATDMHRMLTSEADLISRASYQGRLYLVDGYPGAVPSPDARDLVHGELYRMRRPGLLLRQLDEYEGCGDQYPAPQEYVRRIETISLPDGTSRQAWIYIYNRSVTGLARIASGDFSGVL